MHYLLFYEVGDDYVTKRAAHREEHLRKTWDASARGELVLGGAFANPNDGAALLFKAQSPEVVEQFARTDPYVTSGAVKRWYVREWSTVVGEDAATPVRSAAFVPAQPQNAGTRGATTVRIWKAQSTPETSPAYFEHATERVFPALRDIQGHTGALLLRRAAKGAIEILVLTFWDSMEAIRRFAGTEPDKAVVEPEALPSLTTFDDTVTHFEVVHSTFQSMRSAE